MDIEEIIRRAQSEGRFRDLPGQGKPLDLAKRPPENPVSGIAQEAGFTPEWAQLGKDLEQSREEAQRLNAQWLRRKEILLDQTGSCLRLGKDSETRKLLRQMQGERDAVARDLAVRWTRDRRRSERYNLLVPTAHQQRTVPSPSHLLRLFLERSPDVTVSPEVPGGLAELPARLNVPATLEEALRVVEAEEGNARPRMSSLRVEALIGFKQRYGGRR
ncbi:MAG: DUF1992 domain-containing protein [Armatimonadetes bacterium]|nr:DUF1992 domain-containing protein [Armatimonadota bacterium]